jgi:hypothetical protein
MSAAAYRTDEAVLAERIEAVRALREEPEYRKAFEAARRVAVERVTRAYGGGVGAVSGVCAFALALASTLHTGPESTDPAGGLAVTALLGGWVLALCAAALGYIVADTHLPAHADDRPRFPGRALDLAAELGRLEQEDPVATMRRLAARWEFSAAALPLVAVSLLAPLTLHLFVALLGALSVGGVLGVTDISRSFASWIFFSALFVGHAHVALAIASALWARTFARREAAEVRFHAGRASSRALWTTIGVSCVPSIVLCGIPPILVAVTGLTFVPRMFRMTAERLVRDRQMLGSR